MTLPIFETSRLLLRPRTLADTDACLAMDSDPAVIRFVAGPCPTRSPTAPSSRPARSARIRRASATGPSATERQPRRLSAGYCSFPPTTRLEIEIGWRLRQSAWRQGSVTEATKPLLRHAFATLHLPELIAEIHPDTPRRCRPSLTSP